MTDPFADAIDRLLASSCGPEVVTSIVLPCSAASIMMPMMLRPFTL